MNNHILALKNACQILNLSYRFVDQNEIFMVVDINKDKPLYFLANEMPFNSYMCSRICDDKFYTYLLLNDLVKMPKTLSFIDPNCSDVFVDFLDCKTKEEILEKIINEFSFPLIVKRNSGSQGNNVFKAENKDDIRLAMDAIYNSKSKYYDHVLLAQEFIKIEREFRVIVFEGEILLVYEKDIKNARFIGNLSPLHFQDARAVIIKDRDLIEKLSDFLKPIYQKLDLRYGGLDVAILRDGEFCLFELNNKPAYNYLVKDNGIKPLIDLYVKILNRLL